MMRQRILAVLMLTVACGNIGSPEITSTQVYEFRDHEVGGTQIFHWQRSALPVRIWVASDDPFKAYVQTAIDRWQGAFLYGEFRATIVADSNVADVIVRNAPPDIGGGIDAHAPQCNGVTEPNIDSETNLATLPMHVFVYAVIAGNSPAIATCYNITMTHELGHVLGIISPTHSGTTSADVMFGNPVFDGLSDRDRLTAVILYSVTPTVTITGRR
jgi:predicted Zn-dependent protease